MATADPDVNLVAAATRRALRLAGGIAIAATLTVGCGEDDGPRTGGEGVTESDDGAGADGSTDSSVAGNDDDGESEGLNSDPDGSEGDPAGGEDGDTG